MQCSAKMICLIGTGVAVLCGVVVMTTYFTASSSNVVRMGSGDDTSVVKKSSGLHILEVDNSGSTGESQGWAWIEVVCLILAIKLGLILTHGLHYCCVTKKLVAKKVARERAIFQLGNLAKDSSVLEILALP